MMTLSNTVDPFLRLKRSRRDGTSESPVRAWTVKFGPKISANLRRRKLPPSPRWHLDESVPRRRLQ
jgi:transposase-like protein